MAAFFPSALELLVVLPLYIALLVVGITLVHLSLRQQAVSQENKELKNELADQRINHEQAKNCMAILRLLRQLEHSFEQVGEIEEEIKRVQSLVLDYQQQQVGGQGVAYALSPDAEGIGQLLNNSHVIRALTTSFDLGELIYRKIQSCSLDEQDKELLKTEFGRIYKQECRRAIGCLYQLKKVIPSTQIVPYQLLDCAYTIELLESYFSVSE